jgi:tRNA A-37 threonylcarbamoyl transferase component Bud32
MLQPGLVLGGIRIDSLLGRGAMGEVYLGQQVSLKRPVAVKRIAEHLLGNDEAVGRFEREAQCVARIQSPHVVAVHNFLRVHDDRGAEHALLVMELVDGGASLRALLANRVQPFDWRTATALILHVADGLAAAAEHGVVHRDIKPDNVMVTRKGIAKLTDFGLAKSVDSSAMTIEGTVMGTPLYLPPEACRGLAVDARGDLYSLGCTWFHLLAGRPPFHAASTVALLRAHLDDAPPSLRELVPTVPEAIAALVHRLLAKDPAQRLASAQALVDEIHGLAAHGLLIPRAVPEIFPVEAATTFTRVADTAGGAAATVPSTTAPPLSVAATMPMATTAATVLASPTDHVPAHVAAAKAAESKPAVPSVATVVPAAITNDGAANVPAPNNTSSPQRTRQRVVVVAAIAVLLVATASVVLLRGSGSPRAQVEEAITLGDHGLALQRATSNLTAHPGDAEAVALVRDVVMREIRALIAADRLDDARKRVTDHRVTFTWLDTSALDGDIAIAEAIWLATHQRENEAIEQFDKLRQNGSDSAVLDRAMVKSLITSDRKAAAIGAAWRLAEASTGTLEPNVVHLLTYALEVNGPFGDNISELRRFLIKRHPAVVDTVRPWLQGNDYEKRYNAFYMLMEAKALSDAELISFHLQSVLTLTSSYTVVGESVTWLMTESAKPGWSERRAAATRPVLSEAPPALKDWNDHATRLIALIATAFIFDYEDAVVGWTNDEDERLRWNAFLVVSEAKRLERIDVMAFHARTLATFNPLYDSSPFNAALAYCSAQVGTTHGGAAKQALIAGIVHVEENIAAYEKANDNYMRMRAEACRERLKPIRDVLARF